MIIREVKTVFSFKIPQAQLNKMESSLNRIVTLVHSLDKVGTRSGKTVSVGLEKINQSAKNASNSVSKLNSELGKLKTPNVKPVAPSSGGGMAFGGFGILGALAGIITGKAIIDKADETTLAGAKLAMTAEKFGTDAIALQDRVLNLANSVRQGFAETASLYMKIGSPTSKLGATLEQVDEAVKAVGAGLVVGGASAQEARSTILQLGQALGSGKLQGDEMRSLVENAQQLAEVLAEELGYKTLGELRKAGSEGEITTERLFKALTKAGPRLSKQLNKIPLTFGQAWELTSNKVSGLFMKLSRDTNIFGMLAGGFLRVMDFIEKGIDKAAATFGGFDNLLRASISILIGLFGALGIAAVAAGLKAAAAWVAATWPLLLIGAGIYALWLIIDDFFMWLNDEGETVFGNLLGPFVAWKESAIKTVKEIVTAIKQFFVDAYMNVKTLFIDPTIRQFEIMWKLAKAISTFDFGGAKAALSEFAGLAVHQVTNWSNVAQGRPMIPMTQQVQSGSGTVNNNQTVQINLPNVTQPQQAAQAIQDRMAGIFGARPLNVPVAEATR